ncbi:MAG TPA: hypothetical protein PLO63_08935 [Syntrophales bacterium]|jgi:hypothetical protein|nr:hypothetical protein [Syntrophales bacterium]
MGRKKAIAVAAAAVLALLVIAAQAIGAMNILLEDGRVISVQVNKNEIMGIVFDKSPGEVMGMPSTPEPQPRLSSGIPVTLYWHMADDADVYLNGVPLRRYQPSFRTRGDEAPLPAFSAPATLRNGDVFTVGGRRGGSFGFMLVAVDESGRVVFKTDQQSWRVYRPGERADWYLPAVAAASPKDAVTVQPNPWHPQKDLNRKFGNQAFSIWASPSDRFAFLTAKVVLR